MEITSAATQVLEELRAGLPQAKWVLIGPAWPDVPPPPAAIATGQAELAAAGSVSGTLTIDSLSQGWFAGRPELIGADGVHPTDAGHQYLADQIDAELVEAGLP